MRLAAVGTPHVGQVTACVASSAGSAVYVVTAGHLFGPGDRAVERVHGDGGRSPLGELVFNGLDAADWRDRVDLAVIRVEVRPVGAPAFDGLGPVGRRVQLVHRDARLHVTGVAHAARFRSPARADPIVLRGLALVSPRCSQPGDSGAPVVDAEAPGRLVGLIVGVHRACSAVAAVVPALRAASRALGAELRVQPDSDAISAANASCST